MQYLHGICDATARPISSLTRPGSAVLGLSCKPFISAHAPGSAASGIASRKPGTKPSVLVMSARAACASRLWLAPPAEARLAPEITSAAAITSVFNTSLFMVHDPFVDH